MKDIPNFENCYKIDEYGNVYSLFYNRFLKQKIDKYGYPCIGLFKDLKKYYTTIHRLVAKTYIPNPNNLPQVNHIDGNKLNNHVSNLEWCSAKHNILHAYENKLNTGSNFIIVSDLLTNTITQYSSIKSFCKSIKSYLSYVVPRIKFSNYRPILGRYRIQLISEKDLYKKSNALNFGSPVYIWDMVSLKYNKYPSILTAQYFTGLKSWNIFKRKYVVLNNIGYIISKKPINKELRVDANNADYCIKFRFYYNVLGDKLIGIKL